MMKYKHPEKQSKHIVLLTNNYQSKMMENLRTAFAVPTFKIRILHTGMIEMMVVPVTVR